MEKAPSNNMQISSTELANQQAVILSVPELAKFSGLLAYLLQNRSRIVAILGEQIVITDQQRQNLLPSLQLLEQSLQKLEQLGARAATDLLNSSLAQHLTRPRLAAAMRYSKLASLSILVLATCLFVLGDDRAKLGSILLALYGTAYRPIILRFFASKLSRDGFGLYLPPKANLPEGLDEKDYYLALQYLETVLEPLADSNVEVFYAEALAVYHADLTWVKPTQEVEAVTNAAKVKTLALLKGILQSKFVPETEPFADEVEASAGQLYG